MQGADVKRHSVGRLEPELNCPLLAFAGADAAAHAFFKIHVGQTVLYRERIKLAESGAQGAADAEFMVYC